MDLNQTLSGETGDWKRHFSLEMSSQIDEWIGINLRGTDLTFVEEIWKNICHQFWMKCSVISKLKNYIGWIGRGMEFSAKYNWTTYRSSRFYWQRQGVKTSWADLQFSSRAVRNPRAEFVKTDAAGEPWTTAAREAHPFRSCDAARRL